MGGSLFALTRTRCAHVHDCDKTARFSASRLLTLIEKVDADLGITSLPEISVYSALLQTTSVETHAIEERAYRDIDLAGRRGSVRQEELSIRGALLTDHRIFAAD